MFNNSITCFTISKEVFDWKCLLICSCVYRVSSLNERDKLAMSASIWDIVIDMIFFNAWRFLIFLSLWKYVLMQRRFNICFVKSKHGNQCNNDFITILIKKNFYIPINFWLALRLCVGAIKDYVLALQITSLTILKPIEMIFLLHIASLIPTVMNYLSPKDRHPTPIQQTVSDTFIII